MLDSLLPGGAGSQTVLLYW